jgi:Outer membrane protein beta-barrel domain
MKKVIFLIMSAILSSNIINAQENGMNIGLKVGANYSNVYDSKGEQFTSDAKLGFAAGAFLDIPLGKFLGIQPEVLFSQKGYKGKGTVLGSSYSITRTSNFIDVPLFFEIKPISYLTLLVGPQYSYLLKQKDVFDNGALTFEQEQVFNNSNLRKNILCFVAGVDINLSSMTIGVRAGWDIQNNNGDGSSTAPRYKNAWVQATLGFRIL